MSLRAAIYVRISRTDPRNNKVAEQESQCRAFAGAQGYTVSEVFADDGISADERGGKRKQRDAWDALLKGLAAGRFDVVVATEEERFARGGDAKAELELACADAGAVWHTIRDGHLDPSTDGGQFTSGIRALFAKQEGRRKAARQKSANATRAAAGKPRAGGIRPFGWEADRVTLDPVEAARIRKATADLLDGRSVRAICRELNDAGVTTTQGKEWTVFGLKRMLMRERNAGLLIHGGEVMPDSSIQPAVERQDWEAVCALLALRSTAGRAVRAYELSGIMTCTTCDAPMTGKTVSGQGRYYICTSRADGVKTDTRRHVTIKAELAEQRVEERIFVLWQIGAIGLGNSAVPGALREVTARLSVLAEERATTSQAATIPGVDQGVIAKRLAEIAKEVTGLEAERTGIAATHGPDIAALQEAGAEVSEQFATWREWWRGLDIETRREYLRSRWSIRVLQGGKGAGRVWVSTRLGDSE